MIDVKEDGSFRLNMSYFDYCTGLTMTNERFNDLFGHKQRKSEDLLTRFQMDIAASIQKVTEDVVLKICKNISKETSSKNLCLSGGVALNCVANGKILQENIFKQIWIQPASGDAGGALGAALAAYYTITGNTRKVNKLDSMKGSYLGPKFTNEQISKSLRDIGAQYIKLSETSLINQTAKYLADGCAVGWMNGRMEFGPRALGGRSILADPRSKKTQRNLNLKVKYRESFRPFAPSVLSEQVSEWFDINEMSPYMLLVANVSKDKQIKMTSKEKELFGIDKLNIPRSSVPAITHVDYSARIQTVHKETNPRYYNLIKEFYKLTGFPILVNTSFNVRGEPIVCTPLDAYRCFMGTDMDILVIENFVLVKNEQDNSLNNEKYINNFSLD